MRNIILRLVFGAIFILYGSTLKMLQSQNNYVVKWLTTSTGNDWDYLSDIVIDKDGNIFAIGNFTGTTNFTSMNKEVAGNNDVFIIKYNAIGDISWFKTIKSKGNCYVSKSCLDNKVNYYITGYFDDEIIIGETTIRCNAINTGFVLKLNSIGDMEWFKSIDGRFGQEPLLLAADSLNNIYIAGAFYEKLSFDNLLVIGDYYTDIFALIINSDGKLVNSFVFRGSGNDVIKDISVAGSNAVRYTNIPTKFIKNYKMTLWHILQMKPKKGVLQLQ